MTKTKKRLLWLAIIVLVLAAAALLCLLPRHAATVLGLPDSAAAIRSIELAKTTPVGETRESFLQDYTLTADREPELVQEIYDWLAAARFRYPRFSTDVLGSGGPVYLINVQPVDGDLLPAVQISDDGRVALSGVFLYWLDEDDMAGLRAVFDHLNTIYD